MTIVVTVKTTDGLVLAADSAASFFDSAGAPVKIYNNANKIFNLVKVWPIGGMVYGNGGIGTSSVETLSKDLRVRLSDPKNVHYGLDPEKYKVKEVAEKARRFLFEECYRAAYPQPNPSYSMGYRVCGYSAGESLAEIWEFTIEGDTCDQPYEIMGRDEFGIRWAGDNEPLDRLLLGVSPKVKKPLADLGVPQDKLEEAYLKMIGACSNRLVIPAMPIQDAVDLARFLVETATKLSRYGLQPETIGGPTEVAAITKYEGFKWIARKHYYPSELNRETKHGR